MSVLSNMPADGRRPGWIVIGDDTTVNAPSLTWDLVRGYAGTQPQPQGLMHARCIQYGFHTNIVTEHSDIDKGFGMDFHRLYWLPWADHNVTHATWGNLAGANLFLTSTFTGCRFVVNNNGVSHVAWSATGGGVTAGTPAGRDQAEVNAGTGNPNGGGLRRTLSSSNVNPGRVNEVRNEYGAGEHCVVIGWKHGNIWTFKRLKMDASYMRSHWRTIATVDVTNLAAVVIN